MVHRTTIGHAAFASEKQANPINPEACEWPAEYFDGPGFWFEAWPRSLEIKTLALDPSKGKDAKKGDYSALVKLGMDRSMDLYCEADLQRRPTPQIVADGVETVREFQPMGFAIESNQFQELLCADFSQARQEQRVLLPIIECENYVKEHVRRRRLGTYLSQRKLRFKSRSAGTTLLVQQLSRLGTYLSQRELRFKSRSPGTTLLVQQLKDFPMGDHDDGPDALEQALSLMIQLWNGRHQPPPPQRLIS